MTASELVFVLRATCVVVAAGSTSVLLMVLIAGWLGKRRTACTELRKAVVQPIQALLLRTFAALTATGVLGGITGYVVLRYLVHSTASQAQLVFLGGAIGGPLVAACQGLSFLIRLSSLLRSS